MQEAGPPGGPPQEPAGTGNLTAWLVENPLAETALWAGAVLLLSWAADALARRILLGMITRVVKRTRFTWDDAIQERRVFHHLAHIAPAAVVYYGAVLVPGLPGTVSQVAQRVALSLMVVVVVISANAFLSAVNDIYSTRPDAKSRPIKGYLQIVSIILYVAAGILVVSLLLDRSPAVFLGGLAGLTAVVLLVFRDTILSLVASIQLTQNDMIAVGDWIEMPRFGADGDVVDIALHTVKVQNWDKTITTIPTHKLIEDSFKNWRGMSQAGGRRIKRAIYLDLGTVRFLTDEEIQRFGRFELLRDYIRRKRQEIETYNAERGGRTGPDGGGSDRGERVIANARRLTNVGTFRAYVVNYLRQHPLVHQEMTLLVRQLQSGPTGLPIEIYAFSNDTNWINYEAFQSDIFDHLLAMVPEFDLRVFQNPSGVDVRAVGERMARGVSGDAP
ncbi:MAG: mechanosensitive ion channel family protein [Longimicrobiales bacterium]